VIELLSRTFDSGVALILWLQGFSPELDWPFRLFSFLGNEGFYLLLLPLVYWCLDRRTGARLTLLFLASAYVNAFAKVVAAQPRPFQYDPRVIPLVHAGGGGFPSGHAQHGVVVWGTIASRLRSPRAGWTAVLLIGMISLSRLYLGVHFPLDLVGGWVLGAALLLASLRLGPGIETWIVRQRPSAQIAIALVVPGILILLAPGWDRSCISAGSAWMGAGAGMALERRWVGFEVEGSWGRRLIRFVVGFVVSLALWAGLKASLDSLDPEPLYRFLRYGVLGFWAAFGAPWIFLKLRLVQGRETDFPTTALRPPS
jgi:membrane-associated phospholipid phosphatase